MWIASKKDSPTVDENETAGTYSKKELYAVAALRLTAG
jgi:hypothetical protein